MASQEQVEEIYHRPLMELVHQAHKVHLETFPSGEVQLSSLISIKTGGCPENCAYCPQSAHYDTGLSRKSLMALNEVESEARKAKANGATRLCMGAAWREVKDGPDFERVLKMVRAVKSQGLEVCCTLGMLSERQAKDLKEAGLYAYNHNIDSSREFYQKIVSTRDYDDRLRTIENVRQAGLTVCTGGILGMGEGHEHRIGFLWQLQNFSPHPESVTINALIPIKGTPLGDQQTVSGLDLVRVIATARLLMPKSMIRLSAGRKGMNDETQFMSYFSGANSIFLGDKLLTSSNPSLEQDQNLFAKVGLRPMESRC
jgi:biotin synthase